jgi:hypothetical protein
MKKAAHGRLLVTPVFRPEVFRLPWLARPASMCRGLGGEMDEELVREQSRVLAIEYLLVDLYIAYMKRYPDPVEASLTWRSLVADQARGVAFPKADPAESDLRAAAFEDELSRLADEIVRRTRLEAQAGSGRTR